MDGLEKRLLEDLKIELVLSKQEKRCLSKKLDCLLVLLRGAWLGESESINKISEILGLPPPKIIPVPKEERMNNVLGQEYLQITSSLLDDQLKEDASIKKSTKVLRPSSGKRTNIRSAQQRRPQVANQRNKTPGTEKTGSQVSKHNDLSISPARKNSSIPSEQRAHWVQSELNSNGCEMGDLSAILPIFSDINNPQKVLSTQNLKGQSQEEVHFEQNFKSSVTSSDLFSPHKVVGMKKPRPLSAALQQRQDYIRSQVKKKPRPRTAKPAFRHVSDSEFDSVVRTKHGQPSPVSSHETMESIQAPSLSGFEGEISPSISVNISSKGLSKKKSVTADRKSFPRDRDDQPFGDVSDALQRVQEMERLFRLNTRRLQEKIGIPDAGFI